MAGYGRYRTLGLTQGDAAEFLCDKAYDLMADAGGQLAIQFDPAGEYGQGVFSLDTADALGRTVPTIAVGTYGVTDFSDQSAGLQSGDYGFIRANIALNHEYRHAQQYGVAPVPDGAQPVDLDTRINNMSIHGAGGEIAPGVSSGNWYSYHQDYNDQLTELDAERYGIMSTHESLKAAFPDSYDESMLVDVVNDMMLNYEYKLKRQEPFTSIEEIDAAFEAEIRETKARCGAYSDERGTYAVDGESKSDDLIYQVMRPDDPSSPWIGLYEKYQSATMPEQDRMQACIQEYLSPGLHREFGLSDSEAEATISVQAAFGVEVLPETPEQVMASLSGASERQAQAETRPDPVVMRVPVRDAAYAASQAQPTAGLTGAGVQSGMQPGWMRAGMTQPAGSAQAGRPGPALAGQRMPSAGSAQVKTRSDMANLRSIMYDMSASKAPVREQKAPDVIRTTGPTYNLHRRQTEQTSMRQARRQTEQESRDAAARASASAPSQGQAADALRDRSMQIESKARPKTAKQAAQPDRQPRSQLKSAHYNLTPAQRMAMLESKLSSTVDAVKRHQEMENG